MFKNKIAAVMAALLISTAPVIAADVEEGIVGNPFDGFFIGFHGGYGDTNTDGFGGSFIDLTDIDYSQDGPLMGVQVGANFVMESGLLFGASVSASWSNMTGSDSGFSEDGGPPVDFQYERTIDALGLAEGRIGYSADEFMFYLSGGLAIAHHSDKGAILVDGSPFGGTTSWDDTSSGWTVGAGAEVMITDNVSVGVAYNFVDLGKVDNYDTALFPIGEESIPLLLGSETEMEMNIFKVNLNYHF